MNDFEFDEQGFLETYMTDYTHSDEIAAIDDIDCWWNGELTDEDMEEGGKGHWFADYPSLKSKKLTTNLCVRFLTMLSTITLTNIIR